MLQLEDVGSSVTIIPVKKQCVVSVSLLNLKDVQKSTSQNMLRECLGDSLENFASEIDHDMRQAVTSSESFFKLSLSLFCNSSAESFVQCGRVDCLNCC